jgi:hypothetical protein
MAVYFAGGILANALLTLLTLTLLAWLPRGGCVWLVAAEVNALLALGSLIPYRMRIGKAILRTDGALIWETLWSGTPAIAAPLIVQNVAALRGLWVAIGDRRILRVQLLTSALAWADLEDFERAAAQLGEADSLPGAESERPVVRGLREVVRATIALAERRFDDADEALDAARARFGSERDGAGLLIASACRANARLARGDALGAVDDLDPPASGPLVVHHPTLAKMVLELRIAARTTVTGGPPIDDLQAAYETLRTRQHSATRDLRVYRCLARLHGAREDRAGAGTAYRRVLEAIGELAAAWADPTEQARFLQRHKALIEEARGGLLAAGRAEDADRLVAPLLDPETARRRTTEALQARDRKLRRTGLRIMVLNVIVVCCAIGLSRPLGVGYGTLIVPPALALALFTFAATCYLILDLPIGRLVPRFRSSGGAIILLLAGLPWLSVVFTLLFALLELMVR